MFPITWNISYLKGVVWVLLGVEQMDIENPAVGFFPIVLVLKKGDLWRFLQHICNQTTLYLQAMYDTPNTSDTSDCNTDTPFSPDTYVSSFSGSGISLFDKGHILTNIAICWLPDLFLNGEARR